MLGDDTGTHNICYQTLAKVYISRALIMGDPSQPYLAVTSSWPRRHPLPVCLHYIVVLIITLWYPSLFKRDAGYRARVRLQLYPYHLL
jgi:hypothetical protein